MWTIRYFLSRIRVLPLTIASLCLLLSAKAYDVVQTGNRISELMLGAPAYAQEKKPETPAPVAPKENVPAVAEKAAESPVKPPEAKELPPAEKEAQDKKEAGAGTDTESPKKKKSGGKKSPIDDEPPVIPVNNCKFSDVEVDVLQSLSKRREQLDVFEKEIKLKASLLDASSLKLDQKIAQVKELENTVRGLLKQYDTKEDSKITSLVKMYENMKPKDAARIFDEMEMPVLLTLVNKMSERKAAPILASMSPTKAKELTVDLADDRRLRISKEKELNSIAAPQ